MRSHPHCAIGLALSLSLVGCTDVLPSPHVTTTDKPSLAEHLPTDDELIVAGWTQTGRPYDTWPPDWTAATSNVCEGHFGILLDDMIVRSYAKATFERDGTVLTLEAFAPIEAQMFGRIERAIGVCNGHTSDVIRNGVLTSTTASSIASPPNGSTGAEFSLVAADRVEMKRIIFATDGYLIDPRDAGDETTELLIVTTTGHAAVDVELEVFLIDRFRETD